MANQLADAQNNLRNWAQAYKTVRLNHERLAPITEEFAREGETDENGEVNPSAVLVSQDHARMNSSLDAALLAVLRTFDAHLSEPSDSDRNALLDSMFAKNAADKDNKQIKSRGTVYGAVATGGTNVGNAVLKVCSKDRNNDVIESATIETLTFECLGAAATRQGLGLETYSVKGEGKATRTEFSAGGVGTRLTGITAVGPGRSSLLSNASFDLAFQGSGTSKIQGWDIISGDSVIARDTTVYAEDRGGTHASLKLTGNCKLRFYFRKRNVGLSYFAPFISGLRWRADGANGTVTVRLGSTGTGYTVNVATSNRATFQALTLDPDVDDAWRKVFDTDGNPFLEIELSSYASGNVWIDDVFCDEMSFVAGRWAKIISGVTPAVKGDYFTQQCSLTVNTAGKVTLSSGATGDTVDSITVDDVELLSAPVAFDTDLATTVAAVIAEINSHKTFPNYIAQTGGAGEIVLKQEQPAEGTLTVVSTVSDNGGGLSSVDVDVSGAALGDIADAIVRRTGKYLPHASSASSGWGDV